MADTNKVEIQVKVDAQGAVEVFNSLGDKIVHVEQRAKKGESAWTTYNQALQGITATARGVISGMSSILDAVERGAEINNVADAFGNMSQQGGSLAATLSGELKAATAGTISDFELMKKANAAMIAGMKPEQFTTLTEAARVLAETTGQKLAPTIDELTRSWAMGTDRALKMYGVVIDNARAEAELGGNLNETGKYMAAQNAIMEAYAQKARDIVNIEADAGDKAQQLRVSIQNLRDAYDVAMASNQDLAGAIQFLANTITSILPNLDRYADAVIKLVPFLGEWYAEQLTIANIAQKQYQDNLKKGKIVVRDYQDALSKAGKTIAANSENVRDNAKASKEAEEATKKLREEEEKKGQVFGELLSDNQLYKDVLTGVADGSINAKNASVLLEDEFKRIQSTITDITLLQTAYNKALVDLAAGAPGAAEKVANLAAALAEARKQLKGGGLTGEEGTGGGILSWLFGTDEAGAAMAREFNSMLLNIIPAAMSAIVSGKDAEAIASGLGSIGGGVLGAGLGAILASTLTFTGPLGIAVMAAGAILGSDLGASIGEGVADFFKNDREKEGAIRDALDRWFADLLKDNPVQAIIDGQLQTISDLTFGKGTDIFNTGTFDDALAALPAAAQEAFNGVAIAFGELAGGIDDQAGQLAAILVNNLDGSLNNLQLLIQATGYSAQEMGDVVVESFLDGKLSALEAQSAINGINQAMQEGIPDAVGAVEQAMDNLKASTNKGGREMVDSLSDIFDEAAELHMTEFEQVRQLLLATGKYTAQEIELIMAALRANGMDTIQEVTAATTEQLLPVLAQLEANGFPFAEATEDAKELVSVLSELPSEKEITLHVKALWEKGTYELVQAVNKGAQSYSGMGAY